MVLPVLYSIHLPSSRHLSSAHSLRDIMVHIGVNGRPTRWKHQDKILAFWEFLVQKRKLCKAIGRCWSGNMLGGLWRRGDLEQNTIPPCGLGGHACRWGHCPTHLGIWVSPMMPHTCLPCSQCPGMSAWSPWMCQAMGEALSTCVSLSLSSNVG